MDFKLVDTVRLQKFKDKLLNKINTDVTAISSAIATEATNRDAAISSAIATEAANRNTAISNAIATEAANRNTAISNSISSEVTARDAAISNAIATEATNRDAAISSAIATEAANRNTAISNAIPTKVSAFQNDSGYLTSHQSLASYALKTEIPTVPTKVSAFQNDSGYLTSHQSLAGYAKTADIEGTPALINETSTTFISSCQLTNGKLSAEWKYLPTASTTNSGIVKLSSATDSNAEDVAATSKAVKDAYDHYPALGTSAVSCGAVAPVSYYSVGNNSAGTSTSVARADHQHILKIPVLNGSNSGIVKSPTDSYFEVLASGYYFGGSFFLSPRWGSPTSITTAVSALKENCIYSVYYKYTPNSSTSGLSPQFSNSVNSISAEYNYFHSRLYIKANLHSYYNSSNGTTTINGGNLLIKKLFNTEFQRILFQKDNPETNEWKRIRYTVNGCESAMTNADGDASFDFTEYYNDDEDVYIISDIYLTSSY